MLFVLFGFCFGLLLVVCGLAVAGYFSCVGLLFVCFGVCLYGGVDIVCLLLDVWLVVVWLCLFCCLGVVLCCWLVVNLFIIWLYCVCFVCLFVSFSFCLCLCLLWSMLSMLFTCCWMFVDFGCWFVGVCLHLFWCWFVW